MSENITIAIIAALGGGAVGGIVVTFLSFWIDIWRNSIKNKSKKKFIIKGAFSEILDAKNYLEHSLELIKYIREQKNNGKGDKKIDPKDIRKQIDSLSYERIQHLHDNIYLKPKEFKFASEIYQLKEIKSFLQMQADLAIDHKKSEEDFFKVIEECYNKINDIKKLASEFLNI